MKTQLPKVWLANLGIEVPVAKLDKKNKMVTIRVSDIPSKIARSAKINKEKFVKYWYGKDGGGNKLIEAKKPRNKFYGIVKIPTGVKLAWLSVQNKHGWSLGLALENRTVWLRNVRFSSIKEVKAALKSGIVFVDLKK
jgi:hypothetical protein